MKTLLFRPDFYSTSSPDLHFSEALHGLNDRTQGLIVRFTLTDLNVRKLVHSIQLKQGTTNEGIELSSLFIPSKALIPSFGLATEVILPWDMKDVQTIDLLVKLNHSEVLFIPTIH